MIRFFLFQLASFALLSLFLGMAVLTDAYSQSLAEPGKESFSGLRLDYSAKSAGMAGAGVALSQGVASVGLNPAGTLAKRETRYVGSMRSHSVGADVGAIAFTKPMGMAGQYTLAAAYLDYGSITGLDELGNPTGSSMRPMCIYPSITYASQMGTAWRWGAALKMAGEYLGDFEGSQGAIGLGFDVGAQFQPSVKNIGFGMSATNFGKKITGHFTGDHNRGYMPGVLKAGLFYHPKGMDKTVALLDVELPLYESPAILLGTEIGLSDHWDVRLGTRWNADDVANVLDAIEVISRDQIQYGSALKAAAGTSLRFGSAEVDYALQWWNGLELAHAITLGWKI